MTVVVDTVVLVRSLLGPFSWWERLLFDYPDDFELVVSPPIVAEYLGVLQRPKLVPKFRTVATRDLTAVLDIVARATLVNPQATLAICRDPSDDKFLSAAKTGGARYIVTEDADLLDIAIYEDIAIVPAESFLQILEGATS